MNHQNITELVEAFKQGKCVVIVDDEGRENEGDIVCAGSLTEAGHINFMATYGRGLICTPISAAIATRLELPDMVENNTEIHQTRFTVSVDLKSGTTTGISCADRAKTIRALCDSHSKAQNFARPGHVFPLIAHSEGLKARQGHTEAAIYLTKLAGLPPVAVICEILNEDGSMARKNDLLQFVKKHKLTLASIHELKNCF